MPEANSTHTPIPHPVVTRALPVANIATIPVKTPRQMMANQDLTQLCARHIAHRQGLLACPLDPAESPHWAFYTATHDAISTSRPATLADLAAKARAAKHEAMTLGGREDVHSGSALDWAWDLVNDLVRLGEGAA